MGGNLRERHRTGKEEGGEMRGRRPAAMPGEQMMSMAGKSGGPELGFGIFGEGGGWDLVKEQIIIFIFWMGVWGFVLYLTRKSWMR